MNVKEIKEKYPYLYETHMHTFQGSACARATGGEMAQCYKDAGYTGIIITDHNWYGNTRVDRKLPWTEWVEKFFEGYREAKEVGDKIGLQVFPAWEAGYSGPEFLIYGVAPETLMQHPEIKDAPIPEQYEIVHRLGGLVIQAHPYRTANYIDLARIYPDYVDGVEIINASHSNPPSKNREKTFCNDMAIEMAKARKLPGTAGSDQHDTRRIYGGMAFSTKLESIEDFVQRIRNREDYVLTDGVYWFDKEGNKLAECENAD